MIMQDEMLSAIDTTQLKFILSAFLLFVVGSCRTFLKSWTGCWFRCRTGLLGCSLFCPCHFVTVVIAVTFPLVTSLGSSELFGLSLVFSWPPVSSWHIFEASSFTSWKPPLRVRINIRIVVLGQTFL